MCSFGTILLAVVSYNNDQTTNDDNTTGFAMVKEALVKREFNVKCYLVLLMVDNSAVEREALRTIKNVMYSGSAHGLL